jgi:plastocyanin
MQAAARRRDPTARLLALLLAAGLALSLPAAAGNLTVQASAANGQPLADVVVYLESASARAAAQPLKNVEIVQRKRRFMPRVMVVPVGSTVSFPNLDNVRHHVYSFSPAKTFELKLYAGTPPAPVLFDKPGIAVLGCNIHDAMVAWLVVVETPYHGVTDAEGRITLAGVPPGSYRLRSWHPGLPHGSPAQDAALQVGPGEETVPVKLAVAGR